MNKPLLITMGDGAGIGPEIIAKAFRDAPAELAGCVVVGDVATLRRAADTLPSPLEPWVMKVHGLAAFAALFMFGVLAASHVPLGWRLSLRWRWALSSST